MIDDVGGSVLSGACGAHFVNNSTRKDFLTGGVWDIAELRPESMPNFVNRFSSHTCGGIQLKPIYGEVANAFQVIVGDLAKDEGAQVGYRSLLLLVLIPQKRDGTHGYTNQGRKQEFSYGSEYLIWIAF